MAGKPRGKPSAKTGGKIRKAPAKTKKHGKPPAKSPATPPEKKRKGPPDPAVFDELSKPRKHLLLNTWRDYETYFDPKRIKMIEKKLQDADIDEILKKEDEYMFERPVSRSRKSRKPTKADKTRQENLVKPKDWIVYSNWKDFETVFDADRLERMKERIDVDAMAKKEDEYIYKPATRKRARSSSSDDDARKEDLYKPSPWILYNNWKDFETIFEPERERKVKEKIDIRAMRKKEDEYIYKPEKKKDESKSGGKGNDEERAKPKKWIAYSNWKDYETVFDQKRLNKLKSRIDVDAMRKKEMEYSGQKSDGKKSKSGGANENLAKPKKWLMYNNWKDFETIFEPERERKLKEKIDVAAMLKEEEELSGIKRPPVKKKGKATEADKKRNENLVKPKKWIAYSTWRDFETFFEPDRLQKLREKIDVDEMVKEERAYDERIAASQTERPCKSWSYYNIRMEELSKPRKWILLSNWRDYHDVFDPKRMQKFKERVQEEFSMTPEETELYFNQLRKHVRKMRSKKAMEKQLRREKAIARQEAYSLFKKRLRKALRYAFEHQPPAIVSPMLRDLSDNILEKLADLHHIDVPSRDSTNKNSVFLCCIADWAAKLVSNIYYEVDAFERTDHERFKQVTSSKVSVCPSSASDEEEDETEEEDEDETYEETGATTGEEEDGKGKVKEESEGEVIVEKRKEEREREVIVEKRKEESEEREVIVEKRKEESEGEDMEEAKPDEKPNAEPTEEDPYGTFE